MHRKPLNLVGGAFGLCVVCALLRFHFFAFAVQTVRLIKNHFSYANTSHEIQIIAKMSRATDCREKMCIINKHRAQNLLRVQSSEPPPHHHYSATAPLKPQSQRNIRKINHNVRKIESQNKVFGAGNLNLIVAGNGFMAKSCRCSFFCFLIFFFVIVLSLDGCQINLHNNES